MIAATIVLYVLGIVPALAMLDVMYDGEPRSARWQVTALVAFGWPVFSVALTLSVGADAARLALDLLLKRASR